MTDDNKDLYIEFQNHPEYVQSLLNLVKDGNSTLVQVLSCGKKKNNKSHLIYSRGTKVGILAILMNVRDVVRLSSSWDDDNDTVGELNKLLVPVLIKALDFDIQQAATNTISAVSSGVSTLFQ